MNTTTPRAYNFKIRFFSLFLTLFFVVGLNFVITADNYMPCTPPGAPTGTAATNVNCNSFQANWTAGSGTNNDYYIDVSTSATFTSSLSGYPKFIGSAAVLYSVTGLSPSTTYYYRVAGYNSGGGGCLGAWSNTITVTTSAYSATCHCYVSNNASSAAGYISNVTFPSSGGFNRTSTWDGFINTGLSASVVVGTTYTLSVTKTTSNSASISAWIDYNGDGDFTDANEQVMSIAKNLTATQTQAISIPCSATTGATQMRVMFFYNASPSDACDATSTYKDVEDYTINIAAVSAVPTCASGFSPASGTSYSCGGPTTLSWTAPTSGCPTGYKVYLQAGTNPPTTLVSTQAGTTYSPGTLSANTTYYWKVVPYNAFGDASSCTVQSFTTGTAVVAPTAPDVSYCTAPYAFTLNASGGTYSNYLWYDGSNNFLGSGSSYTTPVISSNTPYYVQDASFSAETSLGTGTFASACGTAGNGVDFDVANNTSGALLVTKVSAKAATTGTFNVQVFYTIGTYSGNDGSSAGWTSVYNANVAVTAGTRAVIDITDFIIPSGQTYGIYIYTADKWLMTAASNTYSDANIQISAGGYICAQTGPLANATVGAATVDGAVYYETIACQSALTTCNALFNGAITGGSNYGIYAPDGTATVTDCEIYNSSATVCSGVACKICTPSSVAYSNVLVSVMNVIYSGDATNNYTNCTNTNMNMTTAAGSPDWTGSGAPLTGTGSPKTVSYTSTGRKTVNLAPAVSNTVTLFSDDFEGTASGWTGQATGVPSSSGNYWVMGSNPTATKTGWLSAGTSACGTNNTVLTGSFSPRVSYFLKGFPKSAIYCNYSAAATTTTNLRLVSPSFSTIGYSTMTLTFNYVGVMNASDNVQLQYSTDGTTWTNIAGELYNGSVSTTTLRTVTLPAGCDGQATLYLGWNYNSTTTASSAPPTFIIDDIAVKKTISVNNVYTDFNNMMMAPPSAGSVIGVSPLCPNVSGTFSSSTAGTTGFTYVWTAGPTVANAGHVATITTNTASSTPIAFTNTTTAAITYTVHCVVTSQCCGALTPPVDYTVTVNPPTTTPTASSATTCPTTNTATLTATAPASSSFNWYTASTGGTLLSSGSTYVVTPTVTTSYWLEATNSTGCPSARAQVTVTVNSPAAPTVTGASICGSGNMTLSVSSPVTGYTYNWYTGSCGGTLVQSSTGTSYTAYFTSTTTLYVSATPSSSGCPASTCGTATATVGSPANPIMWLGVNNNGGTNLNTWFIAANWTGGCIPTCATNVSIPPNGGTIICQPDIGFNATNAACQDINLQAGSVLSFSDTKGELDVCGNFTHDGDFKTDYSVSNGFSKGKVVFMGTAGQNYANSHAASNSANFFNDVIINNTTSISTTPNGVTLSYSSSGKGNMTLGTGGNLTFVSGKVYTLTTDTVVILNGATSSISGHSSTSYVSGGTTTSTANNGKGNLKRYLQSSGLGSYDFPVGQATYELNNINFTTAPSPALKWLNANFNAYATTPGPTNESECSVTYNVNALDNGFWDVSSYTSYNNTGQYDMTLYNTGYTNASAGWTIMAEHNGSSTWSVLNGDGSTGLCVNTPVTAVLRQYMRGFSHFGTAQSSVVLPIELLSFNAIYNGRSADVNWTTAVEINNSYFNVEKSTDGTNFSFLQKVMTKAPGGNSQSNINYTINDGDVETSTTYYYRLKQYDNNGTFKYSPIVPLTIAGGENIFVVKPNPTSKLADVSYQCYSSESATLRVYDDRGRLVVSKEMSCQIGTNTTTIDLTEQPEGMYFIVLSANNNVYKAKLVKSAGN